jgi:hypothetical protein
MLQVYIILFQGSQQVYLNTLFVDLQIRIFSEGKIAYHVYTVLVLEIEIYERTNFNINFMKKC